MSYKIIGQGDWQNCYDDQWKGLLWEDKESGESAFSHPAKFARGLIFRIIEYALQGGLIQPGGIILDPFGGVALGALPTLTNGLNWIGCELEPRFVELGRKNIELWNAKFSSMPRWTGTAQIFQGDSRRLSDVVKTAGLMVSSPPYFNQETPDWSKKELSGNKDYDRSRPAAARLYGTTNGQLAALKEGDITAVISSPPFAGNTGGRGEASRNGIDAALFDRHSGGMKKGTGSDPANLDHLPLGQVSAVIGSPPYADGLGHDTGHPRLDEKMDAHRAKNGSGRCNGYGDEKGNMGAMVVGSPPFAGSIGSDDPAKRGGLLVSDPKRVGDVNLTGSYGRSDGQLGAMVVGSPPYENSVNTTDKGGIDWEKAGRPDRLQVSKSRNGVQGDMSMAYGSTPGQIGTESGETFWSAARLIVDQCYQILPDNAAAIWVLKAYIKGGKVVDFPGQWQALCEVCGFETVEIIRAWLVKRNGVQATIEGGAVNKDIARKSFFRRLAEKNGSPPIDFETVLVTRKRGT